MLICNVKLASRINLNGVHLLCEDFSAEKIVSMRGSMRNIYPGPLRFSSNRTFAVKKTECLGKLWTIRNPGDGWCSKGWVVNAKWSIELKIDCGGATVSNFGEVINY